MIQRLIEKIQKTKAPICVGLDPMLSYIPEHIVEKSFHEFGETLEAVSYTHLDVYKRQTLRSVTSFMAGTSAKRRKNG